MKSIIYWHPLIYEFGIRFLYFDGLKILKPIIGEKKQVFEPASGYGRMKRYIHRSCDYSGFDLNKRFVRYGNKNSRNLSIGNIFDVKNWKMSDVVLLSDILHHLTVAEIKKVLATACKFAREKIVIIEPAFVTVAAKKNFFSRILGVIMAALDNDGINKIEKWLSLEEYNSLFESLKESNKIQKMKIKKFRKHFFVEMLLN